MNMYVASPVNSRGQSSHTMSTGPSIVLVGMLLLSINPHLLISVEGAATRTEPVSRTRVLSPDNGSGMLAFVPLTRHQERATGAGI